MDERKPAKFLHQNFSRLTEESKKAVDNNAIAGEKNDLNSSI